MHYSFESWADWAGGAGSQTPSDATSEAARQSFPFSDDLSELEESLAMGFHEGMAGFSGVRENPPSAEPVSHPADDAHWDALARAVAEHVLSCLAETQTPLKTELDKFRRQADEYYRDNRAMAVQIQRLLSEREQMNHALRAYELELARYRSLMGHIYFKV